jgi:predicted RNase H-like HicB family nuclease
MGRYTIIVRQDGPHYVALCLELNVASQGDSPEEARENISDAINEFLAYLEEVGAIDEVQPVTFDLLREFLLEGMPDTHCMKMEVYALAA